MAVLFKPILPPTRSGRTFLVAAVVLGLSAMLQLLALAWSFAHGFPARRAPLAAANPSTAVAAAASATVPAPLPALPTPVPAARVGALPAPSALPPEKGEAGIPPEQPQLSGEVARPTPAPPTRFQGNPANLLEYARALRQRGDTNSALARLRDALAIQPNNPDLIAETALTYEAMQLPDRAFEQWQRIFAMSESIGALYYLADSKLHNAPGQPGATASGPVNTGTGRDRNGFQDNAVLKITDLHTEELLDDPAADKKTALRIVVKGRPGTAVDPGKVKIEVYFYDLLDGKDVVLTNAQTSSEWLSQPVDWANDASEVLQTTYTRLRSDPAAASSPVAVLAASTPTPAPGSNPLPGTAKGKRKRPSRAEELKQALAASTPETEQVHVRIYLGYSVRLYYDRQLQDVQADPIRLLQQFPPPLTLPVE